MKSLQVNIIGMGILGVVIVLLAIVLVKMKDTASCLNPAYPTYNVTNCINGTGGTGATALGSNAGVLDNIVTAVQTPISYFALIVLVIVFVFLLGFLIKKLSSASGKGGNNSMD